MSNFKPLGDRILVRPDSKNEEKKSKGGLILTDSIQRGTKVYGEVVSVGTGIFSQNGERIPITVQVGDKVLYTKQEASNTIKIKVIDKPSITIQPIATKVCLDKALQLTVDAISNDNSSPLYQWFYQQDLNAQPVPIANATGAEFNIAKFKISDEGHYYATLTNSVGTTTSDKVIVTANDVPIINSIESIPSIESGICINTALQLNATVSNIANSTNTISWEQNGVTLPGQSNLQIRI